MFLSRTTITGTGSIVAGAVPSARAIILIESAITGIELEGATISAAFTVPADKGRSLIGASTISGAVTVNGELLIGDTLTLEEAITISGYGSLSLGSESSTITWAHADAKITGDSYEFTPESGKTDGTLATADDSAVIFTSSGINGFWGSATLAFGVSDLTLTIKDATSVSGVVLDVATNGKIVVEEDIVLTLALGGDSDGVLSGGIFTKVVAGGTGNTVVKANAAGVKSSSGAFADATALGVAKVLTSGTGQGNGDLITTSGAVATLTGASGGASSIAAGAAFNEGA